MIIPNNPVVDWDNVRIDNNNGSCLDFSGDIHALKDYVIALGEQLDIEAAKRDN
jgi:hypothetical protein